MEMFVVKKLVDEKVVCRIPNENKIIRWKGPDARIKMSFEDLEKVVYDPDAVRLFTNGLLFIEDKDCRIRLGLEPDDGLQNEAKLVLEKSAIVTLLYGGSFEEFKEKIEKMAKGTIELLIQTAVNTPKQLTVEKSDYIKNKFFVDVVKIQAERREEKATKEG